MYTVSKGPSKIVQKTRRGFSQKLDSLDLENNNNSHHTSDISPKRKGRSSVSPDLNDFVVMGRSKPTPPEFGPRDHGQHDSGGGRNMRKSSPQYPVFTNNSSSSKRDRYFQRLSQEKPHPKQEQIVRYVSTKWDNVQKELEAQEKTSKLDQMVKVYHETEPIPELRDFEPFDLESWWGRKLYKTLTQGNC